MPFTQMLDPIYERIAGELGLPRNDAMAELLAASVPEWPPFSDAIEWLAKLGARDRLVALTHADNWALDCMSRALGDPFDDRVAAEDVGANKPDPQVFACGS
jgi:putative hydrolase of the HAD superfamily